MIGSLVPPARTVWEVFESAVRAGPDRTAMALPDARVSYKELHALALSYARGLLAEGVQRGDRICIWLPNSTEWAALAFAGAAIGAITVPINTRLRTEEVEHIVRQAEPRMLVFAPRIGPTDLQGMVRALVPHLPRTISVGDSDVAGARTLDALIAGGASTDAAVLASRVASSSAEDVAHIQYTSGTTSRPKGAMLTHANLTRNAAAWCAQIRATSADVFFTPAPLFHVGGYVGSLLGAVAAHATFVTMPHFEAPVALELMARHRVSVIRGPQTVFLRLLAEPGLAELDLSSLRTGICGSSTLTARLAVARDLRIPDLTTLYGLSEAATSVTIGSLDEPLEERLANEGVALPGVEVAIVDPVSGERLGPGRAGEIAIRGWNLMRGYYGMPAETAAAIDAAGWFHTGDLGSLDASGHLSFLSRLKDLVRVGGENVSAAEVESFLDRHPKIYMSQIVAAPDDRLGEVCIAFVKLRGDAGSCTAEEILAHCRGKIASFKIPRRVIFVDEFPLTANGKVQKTALRDLARALAV